MSDTKDYSSILREYASPETDPGLIPSPTLIEIAKYIDEQAERIKELEELLKWINIHQVHSNLCSIQFRDTEKHGCTCCAKSVEMRIEQALEG